MEKKTTGGGGGGKGVPGPPFNYHGGLLNARQGVGNPIRAEHTTW